MHLGLDLSTKRHFNPFYVAVYSDRAPSRFPLGRFDTVLMNPPFGTRRSGIDVIFLETALEVW